MDQTNKNFFAKGLYWPWGIVLFFVILAGSDALITYYAFSRHPDRTTSNAYDDATRYQSVVEELTRAKDWGLTAELQAQSLGERKYNLKLTLKGAQAGDKVSAKLRHSRYSDSDRQVEFTASTDKDIFSATAELPRAGNWEADIVVSRGAESGRVRLPLEIN